MEIKGKVALVTGGAVRVGKAIALMLAAAGAHVVVNYNASATAAQATVAEIQAHGVEGLAVQCDVADAACRAAHGTDHPRPLRRRGHHRQQRQPLRQDADPHGRSGDLAPGDPHLHRRALLYRQCPGAGHAGTRRTASSSTSWISSAWTPWHKFTAHAVGKAGLLALTRQLALELAPTVRVNAVAPGAVLPPDDYTPAKIQAIANKKTLLDRWGTPDDVTRAVRYLIEADYVTGDVLTVDGGERHAQHKRTNALEAAHGLA